MHHEIFGEGFEANSLACRAPASSYGREIIVDSCFRTERLNVCVCMYMYGYVYMGER